MKTTMRSFTTLNAGGAPTAAARAAPAHGFARAARFTLPTAATPAARSAVSQT
ncbi:MAG: hypothetical protein GAK41_00822 [Burkholderia gladioli]|nr:MAG: hypothetical protein GAK41_00822 [Burkholderia gladioli]